MGESVIPSRGDGFLTTAEAAQMVGVRPETIRQWRRRGWLAAQGLDERGYPLHTREAVRAAERRVRDNGIEASGIDPRLLRRFTRTLGRVLRVDGVSQLGPPPRVLEAQGGPVPSIDEPRL